MHDSFMATCHDIENLCYVDIGAINDFSFKTTRVQEEDTITEAKYFLKRYHIDDSNQKKLGRQLGQMVSCHPAVVFELVLEQLMSYNGNIAMVVEGFRYLTRLDRDVLTWV